MTAPQLDIAETTVPTVALTARQRKFVVAFSVFAALTLVAFLIVTAQADAAINAFSDSVARNLLHK